MQTFPSEAASAASAAPISGANFSSNNNSWLNPKRGPQRRRFQRRQSEVPAHSAAHRMHAPPDQQIAAFST